MPRLAGTQPLAAAGARPHVARPPRTSADDPQGRDREPEPIGAAGDGAAVLYTARYTALDGHTSTGSGIDVFELDDAGLIQVIRYY